MTLADDVTSRFEALAPPGARCLVAVSGGPDSLALLDLLHLGAPHHRRDLVVGHIDHGVSAESASVARQVERAASERGLAFASLRLELGAGATETMARRARRAALRELAADVRAEWIVLAHHADDQAETILLRILRGSGPAGLAGMAARRGRWLRPLLGIRRADLAAYLAERGIAGWNDPANSDPRHLRSWLRAGVLPLISGRLPDVTERLLAAGRQAAAARRAWDAIPEALPALQLQREPHGISVAASPLSGYRSEVRHAVLAALGRQFGVPLGARRLQAIDRLLGSGRRAGRVRLSRRLEAELAGDRLALYSGGMTAPVPAFLAPGFDGLIGEAKFTVQRAVAGQPVRTAWDTVVEPGEYVARRWQPGDRIRPLGGSGSRSVSVLFREARVAPRFRMAWPVVVDAAGATIIWVPGICRSDARLPPDGTEAWHVECAFPGVAASRGRP